MPAFRALGDLSTSFLLSRQTTVLKTQIQQHSTELATGQTSNLAATVRGDFRAISSIEHGLSLLKTDKLTIAEAQGFATAAQAALGVVQNRAEVATGALLSVPDAPTLQTIQRVGRDVRETFEAAVGAINQKTADRALFAGDATDGIALASVDTMMAEIETVVTGLTTAADVEAAVDAWFDTPGAGFDLVGYTGSDTSLASFRLGAGETADFQTTAADPAFRELMKGLAMGSLLSGSAFAGNVGEKTALAKTAAESVLSASGGIIDIQAVIGNGEAAIAAAMSRNGAEATALEIARSELTGVDPFDAATKLETSRTQLETLFALTARISRLSLVDYIR